MVADGDVDVVALTIQTCTHLDAGPEGENLMALASTLRRTWPKRTGSILATSGIRPKSAANATGAPAAGCAALLAKSSIRSRKSWRPESHPPCFQFWPKSSRSLTSASIAGLRRECCQTYRPACRAGGHAAHQLRKTQIDCNGVRSWLMLATNSLCVRMACCTCSRACRCSVMSIFTDNNPSGVPSCECTRTLIGLTSRHVPSLR